MKFVSKFLLGFLPCILILAAVAAIVTIAQHMPGLAILPLAAAVAYITWKELF